MKQVKTFSEYMNDETRVFPAEREKINFEIELIGKVIEAQSFHLIQKNKIKLRRQIR